MTLKTIPPVEAASLLAKGAVAVDVRDPDEHAREHLAGARNIPVGALDRPIGETEGPILFYCRTGTRTGMNANRLAQASPCEAYIIEGGIDAWKQAGLPVARNAKAPLELIRQVQIAAGGLVLAGVVLGFLVAPAFFGLSAFVGAGLVFAGVTGWCGMARLLAVMPWNRAAA